MLLPLPSENPVTLGELPVAVQEKADPDASVLKVIFVVWPEQIEGAGGLTNITGTGKTVTT